MKSAGRRWHAAHGASGPFRPGGKPSGPWRKNREGQLDGCIIPSLRRERLRQPGLAARCQLLQPCGSNPRSAVALCPSPGSKSAHPASTAQCRRPAFCGHAQRNIPAGSHKNSAASRQRRRWVDARRHRLAPPSQAAGLNPDPRAGADGAPTTSSSAACNRQQTLHPQAIPICPSYAQAWSAPISPQPAPLPSCACACAA